MTISFVKTIVSAYYSNIPFVQIKFFLDLTYPYYSNQIELFPKIQG